MPLVNPGTRFGKLIETDNFIVAIDFRLSDAHLSTLMATGTVRSQGASKKLTDLAGGLGSGSLFNGSFEEQTAQDAASKLVAALNTSIAKANESRQ